MMHLPDLAEIEASARIVYRQFQATPQYRWALLGERLGTDCWVKHENHTPVGAFKIRGGLTYFEQLARTGALPREVVSATRGNHGQSIGWAARAHGVACTIVVPHGNSTEKNAAMRALGVTLIEHGDDFQAAREHAERLAAERGAHMVPSFHPALISGVSTYWWEFFQAVPQLDVVYVPIGLGSGACSAIAARRALGHRARIVGVVSTGATTYADSMTAGRVVEVPVSTRLADGMAVRRADADALAVLRWIKVGERKEFTRRDAQRAMHGRFSKVERLEQALAVLRDNYIISGEKKSTTGGRASAFYLVNPKLYTMKVAA